MPPNSPLIALLAIITGLPLGEARSAERPLRQTINAEVKAAWAAQKIVPPVPSSDATYLRRLYLDLVGVIPTYAETVAFLQDADPHKREKLADKLLADPRFATQQAHVWDLVLFGRNPQNGEATRKRESFKNWLASQFARNEPYDRWVRKLLTGEEEGSELYYVQYRNQPEEATVAVTRIFLGTQLQCARCHDHPFEEWTQRDFYGMAGFLVRLVVVDGGGGKRKFRIGEKSTGEVLFSGSVKEQKPGQKGEPVRPKFLGGAELVEPPLPKDFKEALPKGQAPLPRPVFSRKEKLIDWLTSPDNPNFVKAVANRVWAQFLGRGVIHPVDDLGGKHKASHPALLAALESDLRTRKLDLKGFIRELVNSDPYQAADTGTPQEALPVWFERARVRPLSAEELMASLKVASAVPTAFNSSTADVEFMLRYFGEPHDGQGNFQGSLAEHLYLNNASLIRSLAQPRKGNLADTLLTSKGSWEEKVDRLFLSVLTRPPHQEERERFVKHLNGDAKMTAALVEEAIWVLLSCSEFRFNR